MSEGRIQSKAEFDAAHVRIRGLRKAINVMRRDKQLDPDTRKRLVVEVESKIRLQQARIDEYLCRTQGRA